MKFNITFFLLLQLISFSKILGQCNGAIPFCEQKFSEHCFVTTHNAFAYAGDFQFPNQNFPISVQLEDGVRALMLDIYEQNDTILLYHSFPELGKQDLGEVLNVISTFLNNNETEVISIIFECYAQAVLVNTYFEEYNLTEYLFSKDSEEPWPTLGEMVSTNRRLVVFSDCDDGQDLGLDWYHYVWDHAVETGFSNHSRTDLNCNFNRGNPENQLFILNHFITDQFVGIGKIDSALIINQFDYIVNRVNQCYNQTGKCTNFLTVDFHDVGNTTEAVEEINSLQINESLNVSLSLEKPEIIIYPNPIKTQFKINSKQASLIAKVSIYKPNSNTIISLTSSNSNPEYKLPMSISNGLYYLRIEMQNKTSVIKPILILR